MAGSLSFLDVATALSQEAGASLLETFGGRWEVAHKADNSVVTAADARAERIIADGIRRHFPGHSIIGEESGCDLQASDIVWVIDPLDGTSNYASGIPWFGVLIGVMQRGVPVAGVMYLPAAGDLYAAEAGGGAFRDGQRVTVTQETRLSEVLWAYGMDAGMTGDDVEDHVRIVTNLVRRTRNVRATNSLVDAAYTADGRLGGFLNQQLHLWDIVAPLLVVQEAGGVYTDLAGQSLQLDVSSSAATREYAGLAGAPQLHREVVEIVAQVERRERP